MISKLDHALALADQGFYVFPCEVNGKFPIVPWRERSTRNPKTIRDWFICPVMEWPQDYNIGIDCGKSGILVVDVDCKNNQPGKENYEQLDKEKGFGSYPYHLTTPSGGLHKYYKNSDFKNTASLIAKGIDTRGIGGFVLANGSEIDGKAYCGSGQIPSRDSLPEIPLWLSEVLHTSRERKTESNKETVTEDKSGDIASAIDFLQNLEGAYDDGTGDITTYKTFCALKERGISIETAIELALEHWNPNCCPPWDEDELRRKAENAYRYAQNATGAKSPHAEFDIPPAPVPQPEAPIPKGFNQGFLLPPANSFPPRDWLFGKIALAKNVTLIIAPPGVGKSTLTLAMALSKTSGQNFLGIDPIERGAVAIFNNEDTVEEQARRLVAAAQYYKLNNADICHDNDIEKGSMLFLNGRDTAPLKIAKRLADGRIKGDQAAALVTYLKQNGIRLLIVDPLAMTHPGLENSNEEMLIVGNIYAEVANQANCGVVLVHHTRKLKESDSEGHSGNLDSARGASSLGGIARVAYTLNVMSKQDAKLYGVEEKDKSKFLLLEQAKANMGAPGEHRLFFERYGEHIGVQGVNEESVGILRPAHFTETRANNETRSLIQAIEELIERKEMSIPAVSRQLIDSHPIYQEKQPSTLTKAIYRLFSEDILTGFKGTMYLEERTEGKREVKYITFKPFADTRDSII